MSNLDKLRKQAAIYAADEKPLHLLNQIEAEENRVLELERQMNDFSLGYGSRDSSSLRSSE